MALNNKFVNVAPENMPKHMGIRKEVLVAGGGKHDGFCRSFLSKNSINRSRIYKIGKINKKKNQKKKRNLMSG
jgi:hypothetical protein